MKRRILITGGTGLVASRVIQLIKDKFVILSPDENELDITNSKQVTDYLHSQKPETIINFAAYTNVGEAENQTGDNSASCWQINVEGVKNLLKVINKNTQFIHISTDMVFSGSQKDSGPYKENHPLPESSNKLTWYGWSKNRGEQLVRDAGQVIVRIIYPVRASFERPDYIRFPLRKHKEGNLYPLFQDQQLTITFIDELAQALLVIIDKKITNTTLNVSSRNTGTALNIIKTTFKKLGIDTSKIKSASLADYLAKQKNPYRYLVKGGLDVEATEKKLNLRFSTWQEIIDKLIKQGLNLTNA